MYDKLFSSLNVRRRAQLQVLSHSSGASSGWLKAISQDSLAVDILIPSLWLPFVCGLEFLCFRFPHYVYLLHSIDQFASHTWEEERTARSIVPHKEWKRLDLSYVLHKT